jgi:hypothetical protein
MKTKIENKKQIVSVQHPNLNYKNEKDSENSLANDPFYQKISNHAVRYYFIENLLLCEKM